MAASPYAATWRDAGGAVLGTTDAGTACLWPRRPGSMVAYNDRGGEHVIRCGACLGCREFDRRRLHLRLHTKYRDDHRRRWAVVIEVPHHLQARVLRALHRRKHIRAEGMYRLGAKALAFITHQRPGVDQYDFAKILARRLAPVRAGGHRQPLLLHPDADADDSAARPPQLIRVRWTDLKLRGPGSFGRLTAGLLGERGVVYPEQVNRYYHRGLPAREKQYVWAVNLRRSIRRAIESYESPADRRPHTIRGWFGTHGIFTSTFRDRIRLLRRPRGRVRARSTSPEALGSLLEFSLLAAAGGAGAYACLGGGSGVAKGDERGADASTALMKTYRNEISGGRYITSRQLQWGALPSWAAGMTARAKPGG